MIRWILCDLLGWHKCTTDYLDGLNVHGTCVRCGAKCIQDSQGGWFKE